MDVQAALQTAYRLGSELLAPRQEGLPALIVALASLLKPPTPMTLSELAAKSLRALTEANEHTRAAFITTPIALSNIARACTASDRPLMVVEVVGALVALCASESHELILTDAGTVRALLSVCAANRAAPSTEAPSSLCATTGKTTVQLALKGLSILSESAAVRRALIEEGAVQQFVSILLSHAPESDAYQSAGWVLVSLAVDPDLGERAIQAGALRGILSYGSANCERLREEAAWALANLSATGTNATAMAELSVLNVLVMLVSTSADEPKVAMQAVWAVANLAVHAPLKRPLVEVGMVEALMVQTELCLGRDLSDSGPDEVRNTVQQCVRAIANLAAEPDNRARITAGEGVSTILRAASVPGFGSLKEVAARCLVNLSCDTASAARLVEVGGVAVLINELLLSSHPPRVQVEAMLCALNLSTRVPAALVANNGAYLLSLVSVLDPGRDPALFELGAYLLSNLAEASPQIKVALFKSGALSKLHWLVEQRGVPERARKMAVEVIRALLTVLTPTSRRAVAQTHAPLPRRLMKGEAPVRTTLSNGWQMRNAAAPKRSSPLARMVFIAPTTTWKETTDVVKEPTVFEG